MEENNAPSNLEVKGDPSVTLTIRLIMQGKVSLFMAFFPIFTPSVRFCSFVYLLTSLFFVYDEYERLTISIIADLYPIQIALFPLLLLLLFSSRCD